MKRALLPRPPGIRRAIALLGLALLLPAGGRAAPPGQALVIGEASYSGFPPIPACALSAHDVAAALRRLGFSVVEQEDASSGAIFASIATLTRTLKANPDAAAFVYLCSYVTAFANRPFLLPVSAAVSRPADVLTQGVLAKTLVDAVAANTRAPAMIALDAIPLPHTAGSLALDRLDAALPAGLGLIAVNDTASGDVPTPFAAMLPPALRGPRLEGAQLLAELKPHLAALPAGSTEAFHPPAPGLYLANGPQPPAQATPPQPPPAPPLPVQPAAPVAAPVAASPQAATPPAAAALPDEDQMTGDQRRLVQRALTRLGYYGGPDDGIFGPETQAAIRRWQLEMHAPMTGHITAAQAARLAGG